MQGSFLFNTFIFLAAACIVVPLSSRFKLGSVLGYLIAGILIGPYGFKLINNPTQVMHFAEFGVVMMLFLIGLELEPAVLWRMRKSIVGLGGAQVIITSVVFTEIGILLGYDWHVSLAVSMALSLSSTALVLQLLQEKGLLQTQAGETAFSVLLFQDIAVIPILILLPLLAMDGNSTAIQHANWLTGLAAWLHALIIMSVIGFVIVIGRYFSYYMFRFVAKTNLREVFTATSLLLVVGITLLMENVGVSPALGAFIAGLVLANSEYKHTLEADIQPFKGLFLGLFFISIGMGMNFTLLTQHPLDLIGLLFLLMTVKAVILFCLGQLFGLEKTQNSLFLLALAQGGEFAFVLFQYANGLHILNADQTGLLTLVVAVSMAATPFIMIFNERYIVARFMSVLPERQFDTISHRDQPVIIAGYGRFGQVIGRFLSAQGIKLTILEKDPDQVELLRRFGNKGYFGDASRLELLKNAGAAQAKLLVVAVDDADKCLEIVRLAKAEFPKLKIFARARNRRHAYELNKAGADYFRRETFDSSLVMAEEAMKLFNHNPVAVHHKAKRFLQHDEDTLKQSFAFFEKEPELIDFAKQANNELERILQNDIRDEKIG